MTFNALGEHHRRFHEFLGVYHVRVAAAPTPRRRPALVLKTHAAMAPLPQTLKHGPVIKQKLVAVMTTVILSKQARVS